jgi:hypothetical protein
MSAPHLDRNLSASRQSNCAATCAGVAPLTLFFSRQNAVSGRSGWHRKSVLRHSTWLHCAARWAAVKPPLSWISVLAPWSYSCLMTLACPLLLA